MTLNIHPVDRAEVTTLVDNTVGPSIGSNDMVTRPFMIKDPEKGEPYKLKAEHGFCALIRLFRGNEVHTVLLDAGQSGSVAVENARALGLELDEVEAVVISHGHGDHTWGLEAVADQFSRPVPAIAHPDAFLLRYVYTPSLELCKFPQIDLNALGNSNLRFRKTSGPAMLAGGCMATTGQIPRLTEFEKGLPAQQAIRNGKLTPDPLTLDDQSILFVIKDKGLVIISGCAHSGIINSILYGLELAGGKRPYAVMGGFHLCWPTPENIVKTTLEEMRVIDPSFIIPCHCTGFDSTSRFARELPGAFILNTVGSTITF